MAERKERLGYLETDAHDNRDPITEATGSHPVGAGVGAVIGGLSEQEIAETIDPAYEDGYWSVNFANRPYVIKNDSFENYRAAYRTGYEGYTRYPTKTYAEMESDLRHDYEKIKGDGSLNWKEARHAARDAWFRLESEYPREPEDAKR